MEVRVYCRDIGMVFGLDKCAVLEMKRGEGIELQSGEMMKEVDEDGYKYRGNSRRGSNFAEEDEGEDWKIVFEACKGLGCIQGTLLMVSMRELPV